MRGLYLAEATMLAQQARLDLISQNISNQRTAGYKRDEPAQISFGECLISCRKSMENMHIANSQPVGSIAHSVAIREVRTDLSPGAIMETGRELDFALDSGYFTIQGENGLLYTRNGRFFLDPEGNLVTADNLPVLGESGIIQLESSGITVDKEGMIYCQGKQVDCLLITNFSPEATLVKTGYNYFRTLGEAETEEKENKIYWRCLEDSNVDLTREMVSLLEVRRNYEAAQKMMTTYDQLLSRAANDLGALS